MPRVTFCNAGTTHDIRVDFSHNEGVDISLLRSATAADHASVEGSMPLMDADLTLGTYVDVLQRLRVIVEAWETHLAANSHRLPASFIAERSRLPLVIRDLEVLAVSRFEAGECEIPSLEGRAQLMGAMYVMEGSRLGGQLIARHVEKVLDLEPGHGTSFFRGFGNQTGRIWSEFLERLRDDIPEQEAPDVIAGAKKMFGVFGDWMKDLPVSTASGPSASG